MRLIRTALSEDAGPVYLRVSICHGASAHLSKVHLCGRHGRRALWHICPLTSAGWCKGNAAVIVCA